MANRWYQLTVSQEQKYEALKNDNDLSLADRETALHVAHRCLHQEPIDPDIYISRENKIAASFIVERTDLFIDLSIANNDDHEARQIKYIYDHYREIEVTHGFLEYKSAVHIKFYNFILENPVLLKDVVKWFTTNVPTFNTVKYGLTNGRIDFYHGGCFADDTRIVMADGSHKKIQDVVKGDEVEGGYEVVCVLEWRGEVDCVQVGQLYITPWHPILSATSEWVFPYQVLGEQERRYARKKVFNLVLNKGHVVSANGIRACTLGHGFIDNHVIQHDFFGTEKVLLSMQSIDPVGWENGKVRASALIRNHEDAIVGFF